MRGQFLLFLGIDLGEYEFARVFVDQFCEHRHYSLTGFAPVGPEIYQHRLFERAVDHH